MAACSLYLYYLSWMILFVVTFYTGCLVTVVRGDERAENQIDGERSCGFVQLYSRELGVEAIIIGSTIILIATRLYFIGGTCTSKARLDGKTVVVTGATKGIGKATALDLAQRGARVILACRNESKALDVAQEITGQTSNKNVVVMQLNLSSFKSVRDFAKQFNETEKRLDVLVNNAGGANTYRFTEDGFLETYQVNYLGHFLLTLLLLEKLKKSAPSRIINVSSIMHSFPSAKLKFENFAKYPKSEYKPGIAYNQSKLAQVLFTKELSHHLKGTGVTVNSLHPGAVDTAIWDWLPKNILFKTLQWLIFSIFFKTPMQGAQTSINCAVSEDLQDVSGLYFSDCKVKEPSDLAKDAGAAKKLWEVSEECTGISLASLNF